MAKRESSTTNGTVRLLEECAYCQARENLSLVTGLCPACAAKWKREVD